MRFDEDGIEDMEPDSSTGAEGTDESPEAEAEAAEVAQSSSAEGVEDGTDTLSIVRDVVDGQEGDADTASPAEAEEQEHETDESASAEQDDENYTDVPFNKHPRFRQLLGKAKAHEADATRYRNIQGFMDANGLSAEEAAEGFQIMALMKTSPAEAWRALRPKVERLLQAAGEVIPEDLQAKVRDGEMSREAALEVSRSRAAVSSAESLRTFESERSARQEATRTQQEISGAVQGWEADRRKRDPNFDAKLPALTDEVRRLQAMGWRPSSTDGVVEQLRQAYTSVSGKFRPQAADRRQPKRPVTGGQVAGNARVKPEATIDIVDDVLARSRAR